MYLASCLFSTWLIPQPLSFPVWLTDFSTKRISYPSFSIYPEIKQISWLTFPLFCWNVVSRVFVLVTGLSANHAQNPVPSDGIGPARVLPAPLSVTLPTLMSLGLEPTPKTHTNDHGLAAYKQKDLGTYQSILSVISAQIPLLSVIWVHSQPISVAERVLWSCLHIG